MLNRESSCSNAPKNALLAFELRLDPLKSASTIAYTAQSIPSWIVLHGTFCGKGGDVQERDQLGDSRRARGKRLPCHVVVSAPRARAQLLKIALEGGNEGGTLAIGPSFHQEARQSMHAKVVGGNRARGAVHNNDHVI